VRDKGLHTNHIKACLLLLPGPSGSLNLSCQSHVPSTVCVCVRKGIDSTAPATERPAAQALVNAHIQALRSAHRRTCTTLNTRARIS
jgi:hypothetical protein